MKIITILMIIYAPIFASNYGSLLFDGNCVTCHHKTKSVSAPSIKEIQTNYLRAFPEKIAFIDAMSTWVYEPNMTTSIMKDAIDKYGLMPLLSYDKATLEEISAYIYETQF